MSEARFERFSSAAGLTLALLAIGCGDGNRQESDTTPVAAPSPSPGAVSSVARVGAGLEETLPPPASGRTLYAVAKTTDDEATDDEATGAVERPFRELRQALSHLAPGDRLVLLPGRYKGPFVVDDVADGTAELPIEVVARTGAVIFSRAESPVMTIKKAHWVFRHLEIEGGENASFAFATEGEGAHHVALHGAHLHDGEHSGVLVGPGSVDVTIADSHIHIFGGVVPGQAVDRGAAPRAFGIAVAPGTRRIRIERNNVHNIFGPPLQVFAPDDYSFGPAGEQWPAAEPVTEVDNRFQQNWREGEPR